MKSPQEEEEEQHQPIGTAATTYYDNERKARTRLPRRCALSEDDEGIETTNDEEISRLQEQHITRPATTMGFLPLLFLVIFLLNLPHGSHSFTATPLASSSSSSSSCSTNIIKSNYIFRSSSSIEATTKDNVEADLNGRLERAKAILEKSKEKLAAAASSKENDNNRIPPNGASSSSANGAAATTTNGEINLPFFATMTTAAASTTTASSKNDGADTTNKRQKVIKTIDEETGLITTDGEKMASLSEQEEWESRGLLDVFENEYIEYDDEEELFSTSRKRKDVYSVASKQLAERDVAASIWNLRKSLQSDDYQRIFDKKNRFIGENN